MDREGLEHPDKWAVETFGTAELGDLRRTDRLVKMATAIAENPSASLPESRGLRLVETESRKSK
jgi:hypothetical protein